MTHDISLNIPTAYWHSNWYISGSQSWYHLVCSVCGGIRKINLLYLFAFLVWLEYSCHCNSKSDCKIAREWATSANVRMCKSAMLCKAQLNVAVQSPNSRTVNHGNKNQSYQWSCMIIIVNLGKQAKWSGVRIGTPWLSRRSVPSTTNVKTTRGSQRRSLHDLINSSKCREPLNYRLNPQ